MEHISPMRELTSSDQSEAWSALSWEAARAITLDKGAIEPAMAEQLFS